MEEKAKINGNQGAFACPDNGTENFTTWQGQQGLTKREYFAGLAMMGLLANSSIIDGHSEHEMKWISEHSLKQADELLKQLEQ